jgi:hypothetical protein
MNLKNYQLTSFQGIVHYNEDNKYTLTINNISFLIIGKFNNLDIGKNVRLKGLPIYGLESANEFFCDSYELI